MRQQSPFNTTKRSALIAGAVTLFALSAVLQRNIDPLRRQPAIEPAQARRALGGIGNSGAVLPFEYTLGAVSGFRQVIAGLLWVRADSFFHQGNYDAILPLVRVITWLDPNFLDVYATGAWHLTYNFTDDAQRSDRRYLPAGSALLDEGIRSNPTVYDMYKEAGWLNYDKIKDYDRAIHYYEQGMKHNPDTTQIGHALAHSYEKAGRIEDALKQWETVIGMHQTVIDDPKAKPENKAKATQGLNSARNNRTMLQLRRARRVKDVYPPVDAQFAVKVERIKPRVLLVSGVWNLVGAKNWDEYLFGPVEGARVDVRLQDQGYVMPQPKEFTFEVDQDLTIMQDQLSVRGGKKIDPGSLFVYNPSGPAPTVSPIADDQGVYALGKEDTPASPGVPLARAFAGGATLSATGQKQLAAVALSAERLTREEREQVLSDSAQVAQIIARVKNDPAKRAELTKQNYYVATKSFFQLGTFSREIDMSKDPRMYSFTKDKYDLIFSFSPRNAPDFVQDRYGWNGEGLADKNHLDTTTKPGLRMLRQVITLTKDDILGEGKKPLYPAAAVRTSLAR